MKKINFLDVTIGFLVLLVISSGVYLLYALKIIKPENLPKISNIVNKQTDNPYAPIKPGDPSYTKRMMTATITNVGGQSYSITDNDTGKKYAVSIDENTMIVPILAYPEIPNAKPIEAVATTSAKMNIQKGQKVIIGLPQDINTLPNNFIAQSINFTITDPTVRGLVANLTPTKIQIQKVAIQPDLSGKLTLDYEYFDITKDTQYALNYNPEPTKYYPITIEEIKASHESEYVMIYSHTSSPITGNPIADLIIVTRARKVE